MIEAPVSSPKTWMAAHEAVQLVVQRTGDPKKAQRELVRRIRAGDIDVKAEQISHCKDDGQINWVRPVRWSGNPMILIHTEFSEDEYDVPVDQAIWRLTVLRESDPYLWDWDAGNFVVTTSNKPRYPKHRIQIWGARLQRDHVRRELATIEIAKKVADRIEREAARTYDFSPAMTDLLMIAVFGDFKDKFGFENRGKQADLESWFDEWFRDRYDKAPSEAQIRRAAERIVRAYKNEVANPTILG